MKADDVLSCLSLKSCLALLIFGLLSGCSQEHPGERVYQKNCSQCHGTSGQGLKNLYPPLDNSPLFSERIGELPCLIVYGSSGTAKTGRTRSFMPPIPSVPPEQILTLLDFLENRWSKNPSPVNQSMVDEWLSSCKI